MEPVALWIMTGAQSCGKLPILACNNTGTFIYNPGNVCLLPCVEPVLFFWYAFCAPIMTECVCRNKVGALTGGTADFATGMGLKPW
jgi:hypothetical protein